MNLFKLSMKTVLITLIPPFMFLFFNTACASTIDYSPVESDQILVNPDIGIVDHQTINIKDNPYWNIPSYPETSVVYFRWYWEELEPEKGEYNFQLIDQTIQDAAKLNKKVVIRFMTLAGKDETYYAGAPRQYKKVLGIPCWLKQQLDPETQDFCADDNSFVPDYHDPIFQNHLNNFLQAMGARYNSNPNLLRLDVGLVGTWGEGHLYSHTADNASTLGANGYTAENLQAYIDMMKAAFPNTMLTIDLGTTDDDFSGMATRQGLGWRADCFGDWTPGWNHMQDAYPQTLSHIENTSDPLILSRWKHAPVDFEICYTMQEWAQQPNVYTQEKVIKTFDKALDLHASLFNLKSSEIPPVYQQALDEFRKKLGYRLVLKHLTVQSKFRAGSFIAIQSDWVNKGSAPSYTNYPVVWRLVDSQDNVVAYFQANNDITQWLPAEHNGDAPTVYSLANKFRLPETLKPGKYQLEVGLVSLGSRNAKIKIAIDNENSNNWYRLINVDIK
ncbi:DUF4832 domain-containing protein [Vibrio algivorus]|uniref:DUF4832 domain-containing protein n=1 Tax=Vibrio algivorus TaxID=1667024 RepID=A0ABQ6EL06_9VIBR|nr:DUF4832 domain-containing protein [Vibrio algivorus]GLT13406.1 DUF4832 domain-containing protein [Vibrio algivorus]